MNSPILCQNCGIQFERLEELDNHKRKFCLSSKYANIDSLEQQFQKASQNKDISKFGNMGLAMQGRGYDLNQQKEKINQIDDEYKKILKQINDEKTYKNNVENEKQMAFRELQALEKQEEELVVQNKRNNLNDVIRRREELLQQEQQLQRQIKSYQVKKKQWEKSQVKVKEKEDFPFEQGLIAGKLGKERTILEEQKRDLQMRMRDKKRQYEKIKNQLNEADDEIIPISQPTRPERPPVQRSFVEQKKEEEERNYYKVPQYRTPSRKTVKTETSKQSSVSSYQPTKVQNYLKPNIFQEDGKVLKFNLNREGKSEEDKVIQSVMAQEYDDLRLLSKLPKGSELYNKKLRQYEELSKARLEAQQKAQQIRLGKMKRQFQFEKIMMANERENSKWVDENRKALVNRQLNILNYQNQVPDEYQQPEEFTHQQVHTPSNRVEEKKIETSHEKFSAISSKKNHAYNPQQIQSVPYQQMQKNYQPKSNVGFKISVLQLKNYPHKKAVKVKLIFYEQFYHKNGPGLKYEFSTVYHDESAGGEKDPFNPNFKNKLDGNGAIAYNQSFYINENIQRIYDKNQLEMYLLIVVAQKDEKKMTNEPKPYCWYSFKVTHFGQIKEGRFTFNLYGDEMIFPIPADMNRMKKRKQQQITIQLEEIIVDAHIREKISKKNEPTIPEKRSLESMQSEKRKTFQKTEKNQISIENNLMDEKMSTPAKLSDKKKNTLTEIKSSHRTLLDSGKTLRNYPFNIKAVGKGQQKNVHEEYFYSNEKPTQFSKVSLKRPLNFDFSISGLRTLPSYIGPVKLEISFIDVDSMNILQKEECLAEVGTDLYNPLVSYTKKVRGQSKIPPTTIIFVRIIALSAIDYQIYSLGFSVFYMFMDPQGNPIISNKVSNYLMATGYYQLPIFWGNIQPKYLQLEEVLNKYTPIPCASLLIGLLQNSSTISNPMPEYRQQVYNTILFPIDKSEAQLFSEQYKRESTDTNKLISGYLQYKGINKNYSGQQVQKYLFKTLVFSKENMKNRFILNWMAEYNEMFGASLIIDHLKVPKTSLKYYYFLTICQVPPGNYYKNKSFDLNLCRNIDLENSTISCFYFDENEFFFNPPFDKNASLLIEVNRIQIFEDEAVQADNIEGVAYTILPLFSQGDVPVSVNAQQTQVKLVSGQFDANTIDKLENDLDWYMKKVDLEQKSNISLSFRFMNGFFMKQYEYLEGPSKDKLYKSIAPDVVSMQKTLEEIAKILSNNYNLQIG